MKKKILSISILLFFTLVTLLQTNVFAITHTLEEIVEIFNNSSSVNDYEELFESEFIASTDESNSNVLSITIKTENGSSKISFEKEGNILSNTHLDDENLVSAFLLADSIGQANGYKDGELINNFNMFVDEVYNYTVENEGFEVKEDEGNYSVKMDITKKVPLIDASEYYLKPEEFDYIKDIVDEGTTGNQTGRNSKFAYNLMVNEDENQIYIGEKDEITDSTYKSILSAIEVMYGEKIVEYFESIYPELTEGYMQLDGFTIDYDTDIDLEEQPIFTGTKVVLVTIDNEYLKDEILRTEYIGETIKRGNKTIALDFTKNKSYKLGFFDEVSSSDAAFLFKYILEPVFEESEAELVDDTLYFNIINGKIVVGDKNNSIFKLVIEDNYLEILPTKTDVEKTTVTAKHENVKALEYEEGKTQDHFRYGEYNVIVNVIYGNKVKEKTTTYKILEGAGQTVNISNSGDLIFRFDIEYAKFKENGKVYIDGKLVDQSNYIVKEGSTIITFNDDYVKNLSVGEHTLKVAVEDGEVFTTFTIANNAKAENTSSNNPKTGDNIIIYISSFAISLVGMIFVGIKAKKIYSK